LRFAHDMIKASRLPVDRGLGVRELLCPFLNHMTKFVEYLVAGVRHNLYREFSTRRGDD
jgi:hypothetical protein